MSGSAWHLGDVLEYGTHSTTSPISENALPSTNAVRKVTTNPAKDELNRWSQEQNTTGELLRIHRSMGDYTIHFCVMSPRSAPPNDKKLGWRLNEEGPWQNTNNILRIPLQHIYNLHCNLYCKHRTILYKPSEWCETNIKEYGLTVALKVKLLGNYFYFLSLPLVYLKHESLPPNYQSGDISIWTDGHENKIRTDWVMRDKY